MARIETYAALLDVRDLRSLVDLFIATLVETNRTYDFFVDWEKVRNNVNALKVEVGILGSIVGTKDPIAELRLILKRYPEAAKAIPILVAVREQQFKVLEDAEAGSKYADFHFGKTTYTDAEIEALVRFCSCAGITSLLTSLNTLRDYVFGVEVGLDSNARKNRSGTAMERVMYPLLESLAKERNLKIVSQKKFSHLQQEYGLKVPPALKNRRFDLVLFGERDNINIETNFYGGGGSKPEEIVESYITRNNELHRSNWKFIWVTEGQGWRSMRNQIERAFEEIDYILNIEFIHRGLLATILKSI